MTDHLGATRPVRYSSVAVSQDGTVASHAFGRLAGTAITGMRATGAWARGGRWVRAGNEPPPLPEVHHRWRLSEAT